MKQGRPVALALLLVLAAGSPAHAADSRDSEPAEPTSASLVLGARVFRERCSPCHGDRGHGDGILAEVLSIRPRNYFTESFRWGNSPAEIAETVRLGRSGVMPPFRGALSEREIWAVANLVHLWATGAAAPPDANAAR